MLVRMAAPSDVDGICKVCSDGWRATYTGKVPSEHIERTIRDFYNPDRVSRELGARDDWTGWFVAEDDAVIVGAAAGGTTAPTVGALFVIYVDPNRRGQGIGSALLAAVTDATKRLGAREQWVSVIKNNDEGIPFYRARGFVVRGERMAHASRPEDNIVSLRMWRTI